MSLLKPVVNQIPPPVCYNNIDGKNTCHVSIGVIGKFSSIGIIVINFLVPGKGGSVQKPLNFPVLP